MNGKRFSENRARKNGFYLALAVCLVAVGIAAWSTYDAVQSYAKKDSGESSALTQMQNEEVRGGQAEVSSQADVDGEKPRPTTGAVASKPALTPAPTARPTATPAPTPAPEPEPEPSEEPVEPANAPLYELSAQMVHPLESQEILKAYSAGAPVYSQTMRDWRVHTGMDEAAQAGEEVRACANGQVQQVYTDSMMGNVIVIEHGDYVFSYCGVGENFLVKEGDVVTKGQTIGTVTAVPSEAADAPHLHLEVRRDGAWMDPQAVLEEQN